MGKTIKKYRKKIKIDLFDFIRKMNANQKKKRKEQSFNCGESWCLQT